MRGTLPTALHTGLVWCNGQADIAARGWAHSDAWRCHRLSRSAGPRPAACGRQEGLVKVRPRVPAVAAAGRGPALRGHRTRSADSNDFQLCTLDFGLASPAPLLRRDDVVAFQYDMGLRQGLAGHGPVLDADDGPGQDFAADGVVGAHAEVLAATQINGAVGGFQ
jgi:hypothetical protein